MSIIPRPLQHHRAPGELRLDVPFAVVVSGDGSGHQAAMPQYVPVVEEVLSRAGIALGEAAERTVHFALDDTAGLAGSTHPERYTVRVEPHGALIAAATPAGLWCGAQSFLQLVQRDTSGVDSIPCGVVVDEPRYRWRGLSLDVVRHFFGPEQLRRVVDLIARYKMNRLHLHLTDDQGWRIESPSRPALTEKSADGDCSGGPGGFLTTEEFRALQDYAADRFVTLVPEIDVPGHTNAATHAYGDLRPDGVATDAYRGTEVGFSTLTLDLPATEPFLRDVFGDLAALTEGPYLHYGGDEAMSTDRAEYVRFIGLLEQIVRETGKVPVAWNEAAVGPVQPGTILQYWDTHRADLDALRRAADAGARIVMSPARFTYLDMKYTADYHLGQDWAGLIELRDAYDWEPSAVVDGLDPEAIEGVEAAIWTEFIPTYADVETMLLPRLAALAEVAWTDPAAKDWADFRGRVAAEAARAWGPDGTSFYPSPQVDWAR